MELTKEYFDKQLNKKFKGLASKEDLKGFATKKDLERFATRDDLKGFATKTDLYAQTEELKRYTDNQTEALARIIATTVVQPMEKNFAELRTTLAIKEDVDHLKTDVMKIKQVLALKGK